MKEQDREERKREMVTKGKMNDKDGKYRKEKKMEVGKKDG